MHETSQSTIKTRKSKSAIIQSLRSDEREHPYAVRLLLAYEIAVDASVVDLEASANGFGEALEYEHHSPSLETDVRVRAVVPDAAGIAPEAER